MAIEIELQRKTIARLYGILQMYADLTEDDGPLAGVIYITVTDDVDELVGRLAYQLGLKISFRTLELVVQQTRVGAGREPVTGSTQLGEAASTLSASHSAGAKLLNDQPAEATPAS